MKKTAFFVAFCVSVFLISLFYSRETLNYSHFTDAELNQMLTAYEEIKSCYEEMNKQSTTLLAISSTEWQDLQKSAHYPVKDVYDHATSSQYYYHSHREDEHGHFHLFQQAGGFPKEIRESKEKGFVHLIAISLSKDGLPQALFTTNQWVTGEVWCSKEEILEILPNFHIHHDRPSAITNRWLNAMLILFRPQIEQLIREKHSLLHIREIPIEKQLQDRDFDVIAQKKIDLLKQHKAIQEALRKRSR